MSKELRDALAELVALRDMNDAMHATDSPEEHERLYKAGVNRSAAAWAAARAALAQSDAQPDTADHVLHRPSGETWVVAFVENGRLCACGWPLSLVPVADCEVVKKATSAERDKLLHEMAGMNGADIRREYAMATLARSAKATLAASPQEAPAEPRATSLTDIHRALHPTWYEEAAERVRNTIIVEGEPPEKLREAIAQRVADLGKPTAQPPQEAQPEPACTCTNPWAHDQCTNAPGCKIAAKFAPQPTRERLTWDQLAKAGRVDKLPFREPWSSNTERVECVILTRADVERLVRGEGAV